MLQMVISADPLTESNCYILAEEKKCVVIDPGESECLFRTLKERGWEPELILLTHEHCDHMAWMLCGRHIRRHALPLRKSAMTAFRIRA